VENLGISNLYYNKNIKDQDDLFIFLSKFLGLNLYIYYFYWLYINVAIFGCITIYNNSIWNINVSIIIINTY
jgi:hypothetical protein